MAVMMLKIVLVLVLTNFALTELTEAGNCTKNYCTLETYFPDEKELQKVMKEIQPGRKIGDVERIKITQNEGLLTVEKSNKTIAMKLYQNENVLAPGIRTKVSNSTDTWFLPVTPPEYSVALYRGESINTSEFASLYLNNASKWSGLLILNDGEHVLHPLPSSNHTDYVLFNLKRSGPFENMKQLTKKFLPPVNSTNIEPATTREDLDSEVMDHKRRMKRHEDEAQFALDLAVYGDEHLYEYVKKRYPDDNEMIRKVREIVAISVNTIHTYFQRPSIGNKIDVLISEMELLVENPEDMESSENMMDYLKNFCKFDKQRNPGGKNWDYGLLFSGLDMQHGGSSLVLGMAPVKGVCKFSRGKSCAIGEAIGMGIGLTMAHEIGHGLSMYHDGDRDNGCDPDKYIMAAEASKGQVDFSSCSRKYLKEYLEMMDDFGENCLRDRKQSKEVHKIKGKLPGERFSADEQCSYEKGKEYKAVQRDGEEFCNLLVCKSKWKKSGTSGPPLPGTPCGNDKVCWKGHCKKRTEVIKLMKEEEADSSGVVSRHPAPASLDKLCQKYVKEDLGPALPLKWSDKAEDGISKTFRRIIGDLSDICSKGARCFNKIERQTIRLHFPAPPGTPCAEDKVCHKRQCTHKDDVDKEEKEDKPEKKTQKEPDNERNKSVEKSSQQKKKEEKKKEQEKAAEKKAVEHHDAGDDLDEVEKEELMWEVCIYHRNKRLPRLFPFCQQKILKRYKRFRWLCTKYDVCDYVVCAHKYHNTGVYRFMKTPKSFKQCQKE